MINGDVEIPNYELVVAGFTNYVVIYHVPVAWTVCRWCINCYDAYYCHIRASDIKREDVSAINFGDFILVNLL